MPRATRALVLIGLTLFECRAFYLHPRPYGRQGALAGTTRTPEQPLASPNLRLAPAPHAAVAGPPPTLFPWHEGLPLGTRLLNAAMPRRQKGMPEEYVRMARLRLGAEGDAIEAWQRHVDDYRGDEDYTAAHLVAAAEALFSERDLARMVAPLAESLPEKSLRVALRDELLRWALKQGAYASAQRAAGALQPQGQQRLWRRLRAPTAELLPRGRLAATASFAALAFAAFRRRAATPAALPRAGAAPAGEDWVRPVGLARQWLAQHERAAQQRGAGDEAAAGAGGEWWWGALTPPAQQCVAAAACAAAAQVPAEVADFAEALEAFFVPPFLKAAAPGACPAAALALSVPALAAAVQAHPLGAQPLRRRGAPALALLQWGGALARTLASLAALLSVLFTGSGAGSRSPSPSAYISRSELAPRQHRRPLSTSLFLR